MTAPSGLLAVLDDMAATIDEKLSPEHAAWKARVVSARADAAEMKAAIKACRPRLMHDDRQQEVTCIAPDEWERVQRAYRAMGGFA